MIKKITGSFLLVFIIYSLCFCLGCGNNSNPDSNQLIASWRIISEYIYFDNGLSQKITPVTTLLALGSNSLWTFGSSSGTWSVSSIEAADWTEWGINPYSSTRKIVLSGWNNGIGKGPIDETGSSIDNIWVIYPTTSETNGPGKVWMKFGK